MPHPPNLVVVTGVAREGQVGEFLARAFAQRGARVAAVDRDTERLEARVAELRRDGLDAHAIPCDLTEPESLTEMAARVASLGGGVVHALVNAAGGFAASGPVAESDPAVWYRQRAINLDTAYLATRALLPLLRAGAGSVVFFSSAAALPGESAAGISGYLAAKAGVIAVMRAVAEEERDYGVRANALAPTTIRTAENVRSMGENAAYVSREEVADAVVYLCSNESRAITGQVLRLG